MLSSTTPSIARDLIRVHSILSRAITVSHDTSVRFAHGELGDRSLVPGFVLYVQTLVSMLHGHHRVEDDIVFPELKLVFPDAPYAVLAQQHGQLEQRTGEIRALLKAAADGGPEIFGTIASVLEMMRELWRDHVFIEEDMFNEDRISGVWSKEKQAELRRRNADHSRKHATPDEHVIPFMLYNLPPNERAILRTLMPPILTDQLVPVVWRREWAPMEPFFMMDE